MYNSRNNDRIQFSHAVLACAIEAKNSQETISDEQLASYIDGRLSKEESATVKHAIAHDTELFERWVELKEDTYETKNKFIIDSMKIFHAKITAWIQGIFTQNIIQGGFATAMCLALVVAISPSDIDPRLGDLLFKYAKQGGNTGSWEDSDGSFMSEEIFSLVTNQENLSFSYGLNKGLGILVGEQIGWQPLRVTLPTEYLCEKDKCETDPLNISMGKWASIALVNCTQIKNNKLTDDMKLELQETHINIALSCNKSSNLCSRYNKIQFTTTNHCESIHSFVAYGINY
jgi:hypothetical protein